MFTNTTSTTSEDFSEVPNTRGTAALLGALATSGPLWVVGSLVQAAAREGFDLTQEPLSMLAAGEFGWVQVVNFILAGLLAVAGAFGLRRTLSSRWAARWVVLYGVGYILSGVFTLEHQMVAHLVVGMIAFLALTAALIALARHFARTGHRAPAVGSVVSAAFVVAANVATMTGAPYPSLTLAIGVGIGMLGLSFAAATIRRTG